LLLKLIAMIVTFEIMRARGRVGCVRLRHLEVFLVVVGRQLLYSTDVCVEGNFWILLMQPGNIVRFRVPNLHQPLRQPYFIHPKRIVFASNSSAHASL
jgi:hypothetical protein